MAERNDEAKAEEIINLLDKAPKNEETKNSTQENSKDEDLCDENNDTPQQEEEVIKKKYGVLTPKKHPSISKDNERAFFDSADWALGKVGLPKSKGALEALRPKLQPTQHQQLRARSRSAYAPADDGEGPTYGRGSTQE